MKKAVIYARYSSDRQTEQSIEGQLRICNEYAIKNGFTIVETFIDRAMTGRNDNRPDFQRMLKNSSQKNWEYVIVYAVDRFGRDDEDYAINKRILSKNGVSLLSATQITSKNIDGTLNINGILSEGILVSLAKYYSAELSQKVKRGQNESLVKQNHLGGTTPYGFDLINKKLVINAKEREIIVNIFQDYAKGMTAKLIVDKLSSAKIYNKRGKAFYINSLAGMLKNVKYNGSYLYGGNIIKDYLPKIIEDNLFNLVQNKLDENKRSPARMKARTPYLLSGKLYCGYCGAKMNGESGTSRQKNIYYYYKCSSRKNQCECLKKNVPKDNIENFVLEMTLRHVLSEENYCPIIDRVVEIHNSELERATFSNTLRVQISQYKKQIDNLLKAIKMGIITESTKNELISLEERKQELEEKLAVEITLEEQPLDKDNLKYWFESFQEIEDSQKKEIIITSFVRKVILYDDKVLIIYNHNGKNKYEYKADDFDELENHGSNISQLGEPHRSLDKYTLSNDLFFCPFAAFCLVSSQFGRI